MPMRGAPRFVEVAVFIPAVCNCLGAAHGWVQTPTALALIMPAGRCGSQGYCRDRAPSLGFQRGSQPSMGRREVMPLQLCEREFSDCSHEQVPFRSI